MTTSSSPLRHVALATLLCMAGAAQATITYVPAANAAAFRTLVSGSLDNFSDLAINSDLQTLSLTRSAGSMRYTLSTTFNDANQSDLFTVPAAGTGAVSTGFFSDSLVFGILSTPVLSFGANFFATNIFGELAAGALTVTVTDTAGNSKTQAITGNSLNAFAGFTSDVPLRFVSVALTSPNTNIYTTVDNVVLSAVPEASTWMMVLAGGAVVLRLGARRRV